MRTVLVLCLAAAGALADDYQLAPASGVPEGVAPEVKAALASEGSKVSGPKGTVCEIWWRKDVPAVNNSEANASFADVAHGALMGVIHFPAKGQDRRGQVVAPGWYLMRLSFFPVDGAHQGVSQTRDFVLLTPASADKDPNATPEYKQLVEASKKASGSNHPLILNVWKGESGKAELKQEGEDWILHGTAGGRPVSLIVIGVHAG